MTKVEVVPHNPRWRDAFEAEAKRVATALGETVIAVHHIGSTGIPGIYAKPVIDMLVEVREIAEVDGRSSAMEALGYEVMGEFGIPSRRYFRKEDTGGARTHQIHMFEAGSAQVERHLAFRDYLIAHHEDAQRYSGLKRKLAAEHPYNPDGYMNGKDSFIAEMDRRAARWSTARAEGVDYRAKRNCLQRRRNKVKLLQMEYRYSGPWGDEMAAELSDLAHRIAEVPGLVCKVWTENRETGEAGGIYLFEDEASLDAYLGPKIERMTAAGIEGLRTKKFDINEPLTRVTRGLLLG